MIDALLDALGAFLAAVDRFVKFISETAGALWVAVSPAFEAIYGLLPASTWTLILDSLLIFGVVISYFILLFGVLLNLTYTVQLVLAYRALKRRGAMPHPSAAWWRFHDQTLPITLIAPAYNEEATIEQSVNSLLALHYPNFEVVVVNDGSKDSTIEVLKAAFDLEPVFRPYKAEITTQPVRGIYRSKIHRRLVVVDKENGGKADALNAGINLSRCPLVCAVDADSLLESDALLRAVQPFIEDMDNMVAVGGAIRVANGCTIGLGRVQDVNLPSDALSLFQIMEYIRAFLMARLGWSEMGAMMLISGAFGIFKRELIVSIGGYTTNTVGEDMEIIVKMHRVLHEADRPYRMEFVPEPVCWTEAPRRLKDLSTQRRRWERGGLETFFRHRDMLANRNYGVAGTLGYINVLITDVLGPPLELLGYFLIPLFFAFGLLSWDFFLAYTGLTFAYGIFISAGSLILEELELRRYPKAWHILALLAAAILENFGYRQLNNWWRVQGWWHFVRKKGGGWGSIQRTGFRARVGSGT